MEGEGAEKRGGQKGVGEKRELKKDFFGETK